MTFRANYNFDLRFQTTYYLQPPMVRESRQHLNTLTLGLSANIAFSTCAGPNRDSSKRINERGATFGRTSFRIKEQDYNTPCSSIACATFMKPAMLAPFT